ncbi:MAG: DUF3473 domain-containing protein, partial [candidate division NC10 bacterium]|nr:DUF3473 domain-containing protein [candidate division NC10 bacterium]
MWNALTVDVEEHFHVSNFSRVIREEDWASLESRVEWNSLKLLDLLDEAGARGTFFVLGWVAKRHPALVREIHRRGNEVACHGYSHKLIAQQTPKEFLEDVRRAKAILEDIIGEAVIGYRAPSFSLTSRAPWALEILAGLGFVYDSSLSPIHDHRYDAPNGARFIHRIAVNGSGLWEVPLSSVRVLGMNLPIAGGGYFRLYPYAVTRWGLRRLDQEAQPAVVYIHPWEVDPEQPRVPAPLLSRFRHYVNLQRTEGRLRTLLQEFSF